MGNKLWHPTLMIKSLRAFAISVWLFTAELLMVSVTFVECIILLNNISLVVCLNILGLSTYVNLLERYLSFLVLIG